ncbi:hypothetical protein D3C78_1795570 [compost metagenome]
MVLSQVAALSGAHLSPSRDSSSQKASYSTFQRHLLESSKVTEGTAKPPLLLRSVPSTSCGRMRPLL